MRSAANGREALAARATLAGQWQALHDCFLLPGPPVVPRKERADRPDTLYDANSAIRSSRRSCRYCGLTDLLHSGTGRAKGVKSQQRRQKPKILRPAN